MGLADSSGVVFVNLLVATTGGGVRGSNRDAVVVRCVDSTDGTVLGGGVDSKIGEDSIVDVVLDVAVLCSGDESTVDAVLTRDEDSTTDIAMRQGEDSTTGTSLASTTLAVLTGDL